MAIEDILNPSNFDELICKEILFPKDSVISKMMESNDLFSILFFGNPGVGKSLSIKFILNKMNKKYFYFNSTTGNKSDLEKFFSSIDKNDPTKNIIVIEEIHRLNKDKQDLLLLYLEKRLIFVFASTTENPFFKVNPAIRSRMYLHKMENIDSRILCDNVYSYLRNKNINISKYIIEYVVDMTKSDFRQINFYLSLIHKYYIDYSDETIIKNVLKIYASNIDRKATNSYDLLSAFHKSIRGSNPNAALYYLAQLMETGDLISIYRRLYAVTYEDIGLANPTMGPKVHAAIQASEALGLPESIIPLSNVVVELCLSPKSNSTYKAIQKTQDAIIKYGYFPPPPNIRDNHYKSAIKLGVEEYLSPHNYKYSYLKQEYLPKKIKDLVFYEVNKYSSNEIKLNEYWEKIKKIMSQNDC